VWIWQHEKRIDDYQIILNCVRKLIKNKSEKDSGKGTNSKLKLGSYLYLTLDSSQLQLLSSNKPVCSMGLCHPLDGSSSPKYKLLCFKPP
jgi:hypothetical protein